MSTSLLLAVVPGPWDWPVPSERSEPWSRGRLSTSIILAGKWGRRRGRERGRNRVENRVRTRSGDNDVNNVNDVDEGGGSESYNAKGLESPHGSPLDSCFQLPYVATQRHARGCNGYS